MAGWTELTVRAPDGRRLRVVDAGPEGAEPVVVHHDTPGSRVPFADWVADARARGLRLIAYDRPGYGGSTRRLARRVSDAADDVEALADELGLERFATWGWGGGGPHALACAARLPERVVAVATIGSPAPHDAEELDALAGLGTERVREQRAALRGREELVPLLEGLAHLIADTPPDGLPEALPGMFSEPEGAALASDFVGYLLRAWREGLSPGLEGWVEDDLALAFAWGFRLDRIDVPVGIWHGGADRIVPIAHGRWLARRIPGVTSHLLPGEGHLTIPVGRVRDVHEWLDHQLAQV
jgi:pimeloyl-ACP methyl ester carboxylesterase